MLCLQASRTPSITSPARVVSKPVARRLVHDLGDTSSSLDLSNTNLNIILTREGHVLHQHYNDVVCRIGCQAEADNLVRPRLLRYCENNI